MIDACHTNYPTIMNVLVIWYHLQQYFFVSHSQCETQIIKPTSVTFFKNIFSSPHHGLYAYSCVCFPSQSMAVWIYCCSCNIDLPLLDPCSPVISTAAMLSSSLFQLCAYRVAVFFSVLSDGPCYSRAKRPNYDEDNICYLAPAREAAHTALPLKGISVCV